MTTGDYTAVALRPDERWIAARMQQGRVLLDHEWNLNVDGAARGRRDLARDVIGPAGVLAGSDAFRILQVETAPGGTPDLRVGAGRMWVGGMEAIAPETFRYSVQEGLDALPAAGRALAYLDVFVEHVQPAEDPAALVDPALAPVDTAARQRIGYRVRVAPTSATSCDAAFASLKEASQSAGSLSIWYAGPSAPPDPCDPPGDPFGALADGLLRVEVLSAGPPSGARFAWTFDAGASAIAVTAVAGAVVTVGASASTKLAPGDLVEVSPLARRGNRADHGPLYSVTAVDGADITLDRAVTVAGTSHLAIRRWDGEVVGATQPRVARLHGNDVGVRFRAQSGALLAGDWWGARLRTAASPPVEVRTAVAPDGTAHAFAPLALIDLGQRTVLHDCRPTFESLVDHDHGGSGACTVVAGPGDDLQSAVNAIPASGGELCLAAGVYELLEPLVIDRRRRIVVTGAGPATILRAKGTETALLIRSSSDVTVHRIRVEGGRPPRPQRGINGAVTIEGSTRVLVDDCQIACVDGGARDQSCLTARNATDPQSGRRLAACDDIEARSCDFEVGAWQTGALLLDCARVTVRECRVRLRAAARLTFVPPNRTLLDTLAVAMRPAEAPTFTSVGTARNRMSDMLAGTDLAALSHPMRSFLTADRVASGSGMNALTSSFARSLAGRSLEVFDAGTRDALARAITVLRFARQGIVVGGTSPTIATIVGNVVEDAVQGIHVSASDADVRGTETVRDVTIRDNEVRCLVPVRYARERHAVFVGNATTCEVTGTLASIRRPDQRIALDARPTPVEAVRVFGHLGRAMTVRDTRASGFDVGVRVRPLDPVPPPGQRVWRVSDTVAVGASAGCVAPTSGAAAVLQARNVP